MRRALLPIVLFITISSNTHVYAAEQTLGQKACQELRDEFDNLQVLIKEMFTELKELHRTRFRLDFVRLIGPFQTITLEAQRKGISYNNIAESMLDINDKEQMRLHASSSGLIVIGRMESKIEFFKLLERQVFIESGIQKSALALQQIEHEYHFMSSFIEQCQ